jgi:hypothetical protein
MTRELEKHTDRQDGLRSPETLGNYKVAVATTTFYRKWSPEAD